MKFKHMITASLGIVFIVSALYAIAYHQVDTSKTSADIVVIDSMKVFGDLERPGVLFPHDKHTAVVEEQGKDCQTCHQADGEKLVLKFKRTEEIDQETTLDIYHTGCISCHEEFANADVESGPVECGECHQEEPAVIASQQAIDFDSSLHYRHIEAADSKCESCHHGYDADRKEIAYVKGEEDSCRTCHKDHPADNVISYKTASHQQCISCHQKENAENNIENSVVAANKCVGCHDGEQLAQITKLEKIPRLDRNQPDVTFIKPLDDLSGQLMDPVVFNHQLHEEETSSCSTCHHETLNSCESCHTFSGTEKGNWVTLAQAMHKTESDRSCVGCHAEEQQAKECAGCHSLIDTAKHVSEGQSCQSCHSVPIAKLKADKASGKELRADHYRASSVKETEIDYKSLPEEVVIDVISTEYKAVHFPHRVIVESMMKNLSSNAMAANFHQGKDVVCQSCHHNSPDVTNPPPKCISCHASSDVDQDVRVPGTKAAYHRQCFECHEAMEIKNPVSTDCTSCHEEK